MMKTVYLYAEKLTAVEEHLDWDLCWWKNIQKQFFHHNLESYNDSWLDIQMVWMNHSFWW